VTQSAGATSFTPGDITKHAASVRRQKVAKYKVGLANVGVTEQNFHVFYMNNMGVLCESSMQFLRGLYKHAPREAPEGDDNGTPFKFLSSIFYFVYKTLIATLRKTLSLSP